MSGSSLIGLGSNLGDRKANLDLAVAALSKTPGVRVRAASRYHETLPVGGPSGQGAFLNAAVAVETTLGPETLLDRLQAIEDEAGRVRTARWAERTLDLDLLLFGDLISETPRLRIPHPRLVVRRFVLSPLAEIAPEFIEPTTGLTVAALLANLDRRPSYVAMSRPRDDEGPIFRRLTAGLSAIGLSRGLERGTGDRVAYDSAQGERLTAYLRLLEQTAAELRLDRWSDAVWGDRWFVTDFWFDRIYRLAEYEVPASGTPASDFSFFHDRFLELRPTVIEPTFLVLDRRIKGTEIRGYFENKDSPFLAAARAVPTLRPDTDDPDEITSEILAACRATRAG